MFLFSKFLSNNKLSTIFVRLKRIKYLKEFILNNIIRTFYIFEIFIKWFSKIFMFPAIGNWAATEMRSHLIGRDKNRASFLNLLIFLIILNNWVILNNCIYWYSWSTFWFICLIFNTFLFIFNLCLLLLLIFILFLFLLCIITTHF